MKILFSGFFEKEEEILKKYLKHLILFVFILCAGVIHSCSMSRESTEVVLETSEVQSQEVQEESENREEPKKVCVYITGCVAAPGVYYVAEGTRIYEVVELAGGFTQEAARDYLNLAEEVFDAQKLIVYSNSEAVTAPSVQTAGEASDGKSALVNLNTADKETLMTLPGIGESKAEAIIQYRKDNGDFSAIEDVMNISGIKEGAFAKIKDKITV